MSDEWIDKFMERAISLHKVWNSFKSEFMQDQEWVMGNSWGEFFNRVCEWVYNHPETGIDVTPCDDEYHMGAMLVYIPHSNDVEYWGTTVLYMTQGAPPVDFFLTAHSVSIMTEVISNIKNLHDIKRRVHNNSLADYLDS